MEEEKRRKKKKIIKFTAIYLACFLVFFSAVTIAKYLDKTVASGNKDIAKWEVIYDPSDNISNKLNVVSGNETQNQTYIIKVTSNSDVKASYSLVLTNVPNDVEAKVDGGNYVSATNNTITINNIGTINANASNKTNTHTLKFNAPLNSQVIGENSINVEMKFVQKN